jgi:hypothetical protein
MSATCCLEDRAVAVREADQRANAVVQRRLALVVVDPRQRPRQPVRLLRRHLLLGRDLAQRAATVTIAARRADRVSARIVAAGRGRPPAETSPVVRSPDDPSPTVESLFEPSGWLGSSDELDSGGSSVVVGTPLDVDGDDTAMPSVAIAGALRGTARGLLRTGREQRKSGQKRGDAPGANNRIVQHIKTSKLEFPTSRERETCSDLAALRAGSGDGTKYGRPTPSRIQPAEQGP